MHATTSRRGLLSVGLALCVTVLAGCSTSHHDTTGTVLASTTAPAVSSTEESSNPASIAATAPGSSTPGPAAAASLCRVISLNIGLLTTAATSRNDPELQQTVSQLRQLSDVAPAEIKADLRVIADFDQKVLATVRAGGSPDAVEETPELNAALNHEAQWTAAHCSH
jgi:hypothetical protein